jgi:RNA polymerase primary sigma factor
MDKEEDGDEFTGEGDAGQEIPCDTIDSSFVSVRSQAIRNLLATLGPREAEIIRLRFGFEDGFRYTLKAVGERLGVTRERVRQIEDKALRRLCHPARSLRVRDFYDEL